MLLSLFVFFRSYIFPFFIPPLVNPFAAMASLSTPAAATKRQTIALVGFGNLAKFICEEISADERFELVVISRQVCSFTENSFLGGGGGFETAVTNKTLIAQIIIEKRNPSLGSKNAQSITRRAIILQILFSPSSTPPTPPP